MERANLFVTLGGQLLVQLPVFLVWLVAVIVAITRWQRHPQVSLLVLVALILLFLLRVGGLFFNLWIPLSLAGGSPGARIGLLAGAWSVASALIGAVAYALLLIAVFRYRGAEVRG